MNTKLTFIAALAGAGLLFAQSPDEGRRRHRGPSFDQIQEALSLTPEQLEQIQANNKALRETMRAIMTDNRELQKQLQQELQSESPSTGVIGDLMLRTRGAGEQVKAAHDQAREQNLALLNEQQLATLNSIEEAMKIQPVARQAGALNLLAGPARGRGGPGSFMRGGGRSSGRALRRGGPRGRRGAPPPAPAQD